MNAATEHAPTLCLMEREGAVATVTLNRPDARNALNVPLLLQLVEALEDARERHADVLVLRAAGPAFCAGADVRADDGTAIGQPGLRRRLIEQACALIEAFPASVAAVHGPAVGGGWALAVAAVVTLAAPEAAFRFPELRLGFLPRRRPSGGSARPSALPSRSGCWPPTNASPRTSWPGSDSSRSSPPRTSTGTRGTSPTGSPPRRPTSCTSSGQRSPADGP